MEGEVARSKDDLQEAEDELIRSINDLSRDIKEVLNSTDLSKVTAGSLLESARTFVVSFPGVDLLGNVLGVEGNSALGVLAAIVVFGWPIILFALYVALIASHPNRRSGDKFEKLVSNMVMSWDYMAHHAEESMFQFMEDLTDPHPHHHHHRQDVDQYHDPNQYHDPDNRQSLFFGPSSYYDDYDNPVINDDLPDWNDHQETPFVNPISTFSNPVISYLEDHDNGSPLRDHLHQQDLTRLTNDFNEIMVKDKQNFLSVVLGTQYQHGTGGNDQDVVTGVVSKDGPRPPIRHQIRPRPPQTTGNIRFEANLNPRIKVGDDPYFRPSPQVVEEAEKQDKEKQQQQPLHDGWVAGSPPQNTAASTPNSS